MAERFYQEYSLSDAELHSLESGPISSQFFECYEKVKVMTEKVGDVMSSSAEAMRSSIVGMLNDYGEIAVERLYQWLLSECKSSFSMESPEISPYVLKAFEVLGEREILCQSCLEELNYQRKLLLSKAFLDALIKGGPNGNPRPIEFYAYDAVRYVGDILAWIHQACASEKELLYTLFPKKQAEGM